MTIPKLERVLRDARIKPACIEMELHPHFQQPELFAYVLDHGIVPIGYSPDRLAQPARTATGQSPTPSISMTRSSSGLPGGWGFIPRSSASSGPFSAGRCLFRFRSSERSI